MRFVHLCLTLFLCLCAACAPGAAASLSTPPAPSATPESASATPAPSSTPDPSPTAAASTTPAPSPTPAPPDPSATPQPSPSPTSTSTSIPLVSAAQVIYRPESDSRAVADVRWAASGTRLVYAISPQDGHYLLDWNLYDLQTGLTQSTVSPYPAFGATWERIGLGYPVNLDSFAELQGFVSPNGKYLLFPNAGFPDSFSSPNYIYVMPAQGGDRRAILGPTFQGKVGKAVWVEYETKVIFDYRHAGGVEVFITDLTRYSTNLLLDLFGPVDGLNTSWLVAPDETLIFVPGHGHSQIITLKGGVEHTIDTPDGLESPSWALDSRAVYYWDGGAARLLRYRLGDTAPQAFLTLDDLMSTSPVKVVRGMPFRVSPDQTRIVFWWKSWIWVVSLR